MKCPTLETYETYRRAYAIQILATMPHGANTIHADDGPF